MRKIVATHFISVITNNGRENDELSTKIVAAISGPVFVFQLWQSNEDL